MLRLLICSISILFAFPVFAESLYVKAGESITIKSEQAWLDLDELVLEDGSSINFTPDVQRWQVTADKAVIGQGVTISALGAAGKDGRPGESQTGQAEECEDGAAGQLGEQGQRGGSGVSISLDLKVQSWGDLKIVTNGGAGGNGGQGGQGEQAGAIDKCSRTQGGAGGAGGDGGDGGNGGNVRIRYSYLESSGLSGPLSKRLQIENRGGSGGEAGQGGKPGEGSKGRYINMRTLTGSKKWIPGGQQGAEGAIGQQGRSGVDGQLVVEENIVGQLDKRIQQQVTAQTEIIAQQALAKQQALALENQALMEKLAKATAASSDPRSAEKLDSAGSKGVEEKLEALSISHQEQAEKITQLEKLVEQLQQQMEKALEALKAEQKE